MRRAARGLARALATASHASAPCANARPFLSCVETASRSARGRDGAIALARAFASVPSTSGRSSGASPAPRDRATAPEASEEIVAFSVRNTGPRMMFRTWNLHQPAVSETWGRTIRERWRRTYLGQDVSKLKLDWSSRRFAWRTVRSAVYDNKGRVLLKFWMTGGWTFVATYATGMMMTFALAGPITVMGLIGFMTVAKTVGAGELARWAIESVFNATERVTGLDREFGVFIPTAFVAYRMQYYTLPVILFAYEEMYYFSNRLRSLARWLR